LGAPDRILILGGTADAREIAALLVGEGFDPVSSLAGRTRHPIVPAGRLRIGPFGGVDGLADYVRSEQINFIVDATHPFASQISRHAVAAATACRIKCVRLERAPWAPADGDSWQDAHTAAEAAGRLPIGACALLTIGKRELDPFLARTDLRGIIRTIEELDRPLPGDWRLIRARPPFGLDDEVRLMLNGKIEWLVSKNAGGSQTVAKLVAARRLGIGVIMIARPRKPQVPTAETPAGILKLIRAG
jgi:precorrin-6A/cobalt-precorrin-6A reductase